jgi:hypothetical protein
MKNDPIQKFHLQHKKTENVKKSLFKKETDAGPVFLFLLPFIILNIEANERQKFGCVHEIVK